MAFSLTIIGSITSLGNLSLKVKKPLTKTGGVKTIFKLYEVN